MDTGVDDDQDVEGLEPDAIILDTPDPPDDLPYADFEDYRARTLLEVNDIPLTEDALARTLRREKKRSKLLKSTLASLRESRSLEISPARGTSDRPVGKPRRSGNLPAIQAVSHGASTECSIRNCPSSGCNPTSGERRYSR